MPLGPKATAMSKIVDLASEAYSRGDAILIELASPQRFRGGRGPEWHDYLETLKFLDMVWRDRKFRNTSFGVFGPQPNWENTIARGDVLFKLESWARLEEDEAAMIAPTHSFANGD